MAGSDGFRDGNIRYFEYENDKFEFLSEYKSGDPQRGLAFVPRRGINVGQVAASRMIILILYRSMKMK
jgi:hypothetical protein